MLTKGQQKDQNLTSPAQSLPLEGVRERKLRAVEEEQGRGEEVQRGRVDKDGGGRQRGGRQRGGRKGRAPHRHQFVSFFFLFTTDAKPPPILSGGRQAAMRDVPPSVSDQRSEFEMGESEREESERSPMRKR